MKTILWKTLFAGALVFLNVAVVQAAPQINIDFQPLSNEAVLNESFQAGLHLEALGVLSKRAPLDVVLVLDTSGSMNYKASAAHATTAVSRLAKAKKALIDFVALLDDNARAALVTFSNSGARIVSTLGSYNKTTLTNRINAISASGNTPMGIGLQAGLAILKESSQEAVKAIIFAADGHHNTGPGPEFFYNLVPKEASVFTIGVGSDVAQRADCGNAACKSGEQWLKEIAAAGNQYGRYIPVSNVTDLADIYRNLEKEIIELPVAREVVATLKLRPEFKFLTAVPPAKTVTPLTDGTKLTWLLPSLRNGEFADVTINLAPKTKLPAQPQVLNYEFPASGVSYIASDGAATKAIGERSVVVRANNQAPIIRSLTVVPTEGQVESTVFAATADAIDPDGDTLTYFWSGGGGQVVSNCGLFDSQCRLKFSTVGSKSMTLVVRDPSAASDTKSASVQVGALTSIKNLSCSAEPALAYVGQNVKWQTTSTEGIQKYIWSGNGGLTGDQSELSWTYKTPGQKTASVNVVLVNGSEASATCSLTVEPVYPKYRALNPRLAP